MTHDFEAECEVIYNGTPSHAGNWSAVIERARKSTINLYLRSKKSDVLHPKRHGMRSNRRRSRSRDLSSSNPDPDPDHIHSLKGSLSDSDITSGKEDIPGSTSLKVEGNSTLPSTSSKTQYTRGNEQQVLSQNIGNAQAGVPVAKDPSNASGEAKKIFQASPNQFHVFMWSMISPDSPTIRPPDQITGDDIIQVQDTISSGTQLHVDTEKLENMFSEMERFLASAK